jgi:hypothetical protein
MPEWRVCYSSFPKEQVIYIVQVVIAYIVIIISLVNLCISSENCTIWATLISGCIGYLFPAPSLNNVEHQQQQQQQQPVLPPSTQ